MKKLCFIAATVVAIVLGMTGCFKSETCDAIVYCREGFAGAMTPETEGLNSKEMRKIFNAHMLELGESFGDNDVIIRRQNNEEYVKQGDIQAAKDADSEVKEKYGDPVRVQERYSHLSIAVYYRFGGNPEVKVATYTYKDEIED